MQILSVAEVTQRIKKLLELDQTLQHVWVRGEISNCKPHSSGHWYLTLKDAEATLRAVMFRGSAQSLRFRPDNGMKVLAFGRVSLYPRDGQYQLYIDELLPDGIGALQIAFEQLKERLTAAGLFDQSRKRSLPFLPRTIGLVTSPTGAAIRDLVSVIQRRMPGTRLILIPVLVQGAGAAPDIARGIAQANQQGLADVLIIGRGGGSIEDLWAFNEEVVARAIAGSRIPTISAVGHETDLTIADLVADLRAPTPSAAAELVVPDARELARRIASAQVRMLRAGERLLNENRTYLDNLVRQSTLLQPLRWLDIPKERLDRISERLIQGTQQDLHELRVALQLRTAQLDGLSPLAILSRGYAVCRSEGQIIRDAEELAVGAPIEVVLHRGTLWGTVVETSLCHK